MVNYCRVNRNLQQRLVGVYANAQYMLIKEVIYQCLLKQENQAAWDRRPVISQSIQELKAAEEETRKEYKRVKRERGNVLLKAAAITTATTREVV